MMKTAAAGLVAALAIGCFGAAAQDEHAMPKPQKEHEWLQQLLGEWDTEGEVVSDPSKPPVKTKGSESGRMVGGFWAMMENKGDFMGTPFTGILTLGYDVAKGKYVGTWIDTMTSLLWQYQGTVDAAGKILTLETEGPNPEQPGKTSKYREIIEIKSKDHKVFKSTVEKDGKWVTFVTIDYKRKK